MKKTIDIRKKYNKKDVIVNKELLKKNGIDLIDSTIYLEEQTQYSNGEAEFIYRLCIKNNYK